MVQETAEQGKLSQWEQMQARVGEYKRPFETSEGAVREMAFRMMYFVEAVRPRPKGYDIGVAEIRRNMMDDKFQLGIEIAQLIYTDRVVSMSPTMPQNLLDYLIPFARMLKDMRASSRLTFLKEGLRTEFKPEVRPLYLAERRLSRRLSWEEQLKNIRERLNSHPLTDKQEQALRKDQEILERKTARH